MTKVKHLSMSTAVEETIDILEIGQNPNDTKGILEESNSDDQSKISGSGHGSGCVVEETDSPSLAKEETQAVLRLKLVVMFVLLASATIVATFVYIYLLQAESVQFETQFKNDANKVLEAIGTSMDRSFGLLDSLAVWFMSFSRITNQSWPYVTMNDFAMRMSKILPLTDAISVNVLPLVTSQERRIWERYTAQKNSWVDEGVAVQDTWNGYNGPVVYDGIPNWVIHSDSGPLTYKTSRDMLPLWQNFPVIPNTTWTYNWDWMTTSRSPAYMECISKHEAIVSAPYMLNAPGDETQYWAEYYKGYISPDDEPIEPVSDLSYPIIDDSSLVKKPVTDDYNPTNRSINGVIVASVYWRDTIRSVLPRGSNGIQVVFTNPCTESFSYQINGPHVQYLGVGDHHDTQYDYLAIESRLDDLGKFSIREDVYSGTRINHEYCPFTLHVYPSNVTKATHTTNNPVIFTMVAILIFAFTSLVFYLYDAMVEKRQTTVMRSAVQTSAIVSSLFPSKVRDRLLLSANVVDHPSGGGGSKNSHFRRGHHRTPTTHDSGDGSTDATVESPIAELYPDTTVLFADIAGFTAWSSTRQPVQVFHLLETLYSAFDAIAKHRGVFKVETVGDCYVAVVGLPIPRPSHAVVMTRFAADCRNKMQKLLVQLETTLGPGTTDLALRIGLNSGPTTGGVLRGDKSRFQLFGDTVNTAARMESNGERNRIHVSQKTADLLKQAGKGHWLTLREEQVNCKGKGMLTTYWCEPRAVSVSSGGENADSPLADTGGVTDDHGATKGTTALGEVKVH